MAGGQVIDAIGRQTWLDPVGKTLQRAVYSAFQAGGETGIKVRDFLHGVWFGHPLHPALILVPAGAWTTAFVLDLLDTLEGRQDLRGGADAAVAFGLAGAVGAAATGITDWHHTEGRAQRVGVVHALLNVIATLLYGASLLERLQGRRGTAKLLSALGFGSVMASGYLGGDLAYNAQVGVDHAADKVIPDKFQRVLADAELGEGELRCVLVDDKRVLLARRNGRVHAMVETCAHLGGPLSEGKLTDDGVVCPWHGSCFALADGRVLRGPSTYPQPVYETRVVDGQIEVRGPAGELA